jgi:6-phospho-beta-glucosidase
MVVTDPTTARLVAIAKMASGRLRREGRNWTSGSRFPATEAKAGKWLALALLVSLVTDRRDTQVVNVRNAGTLPFLPDEAVIEVPAVIGADGARPVPLAALDPLLRGLVGHVSAYEDLAVEAAIRGGRRRVLAALLAHPLIGQYDVAGQLADRLITENLAYLPWAAAAAAR